MYDESFSYSVDGCIKIWNHRKTQIAEIVLDNTLTYCCFLNFDGDLIAGWKNHIFKIRIDKVIPRLKKAVNNDSDVESLEAFYDEIRDDGEY